MSSDDKHRDSGRVHADVRLAPDVEETPNGDKLLFKNKYTGKEVHILKREDVQDGEEVLSVYTLSDGSREESGQFITDWHGVEQ
jgi:hypothetical protein